MPVLLSWLQKILVQCDSPLRLRRPSTGFARCSSLSCLLAADLARRANELCYLRASILRHDFFHSNIFI